MLLRLAGLLIPDGTMHMGLHVELVVPDDSRPLGFQVGLGVLDDIVFQECSQRWKCLMALDHLFWVVSGL